MDIEKRVIKIINENIEGSEIEVGFDTSLKDDLGLDSLNLIMILNALEDEFDITLDEEEIYKAENVGEVINNILKIGEN